MDRLRDQRGSADALTARAARLLSARGPLVDDELRKARVRARLKRRRARPELRRMLQAALVLLVLLSVAAASAMIGRVGQAIFSRAQQRRRAAATRPPHQNAARTATAAKTADPASAAPAAPAPAVVPAETPAPPTAPRAVRAATVMRTTEAHRGAAKPALPAPHSPTPAATTASTPAATPAPMESEEQLLLTAAVRALRHEHDYERATRLLSTYLERYPDGMVAEEALALALEATVGRDTPRAAQFARRYLTRYPDGRWRGLARRAAAP
jgi:hypothetical protein